MTLPALSVAFTLGEDRFHVKVRSRNGRGFKTILTRKEYDALNLARAHRVPLEQALSHLEPWQQRGLETGLNPDEKELP